jgi:hypothetical protein
MNDDPSFATLNFGDPDAIQKFYSVLGLCINEWSYVDRGLFDCFRLFLATDEKRAAIVYYSISRFEGRKNLADELSAIALNDADQRTAWDEIVAEIRRLQPFRNIIAHQPVLQTGEIIWDMHAPGGPAVVDAKVIFQVTIEEKEILRGKKSPRKILKEELDQHLLDITKLHRSVRKFAERYASAQQLPLAP